MKKDFRATDFYKNMSPYHACECAERFGSGENAGKDETLAAWQYIYDQGMHHYLQGFYGRTLKALIEQGLINTKEN